VLTVFYDLESTDKLFCGQILNYSFIEVGDDFEVRSECSGKIHISRLQLPSPDAILANRTDVLKHQAENAPKERDALGQIWAYLAGIISDRNETLKLIGYNSSKFDLPFLRTSFIRCGINPYFEGKLVSGDLLFASRKLAATHPEFPRPLGPDGRLSLRLESITHALELLAGPQTHESRDDVLLTIRLAKLYRDRFGLDVRSFAPYEVPLRGTKGDIRFSVTPLYDCTQPLRSELTPMMLLEADHRQALWVNLKKFASETALGTSGTHRNAVSWFNRATHSFFCGEGTLSDEIRSLAKDALDRLGNVTLENFFSKSLCDIELDIYRLDFDAIEALRSSIWDRDSTQLKALANKDALTVYNRHRLSHYPGGTAHEAKVSLMLREYALYRYSGNMVTSKGGGEGSLCHDSLSCMMKRIGVLEETGTASDKELLAALKTFYLESEIFRVAGEDLMAIPSERLIAAQPSTLGGMLSP